jgi:hypothetical protein
MKRFTAILLVALILFNVMGFYGVLVALRYQNEQSFLGSLDNGHYNASQTRLIKIPLAIPYAMEQQEYERVNGDFNFEGNHYRLVKQRLANDTLYVVCILDHGTNKLNQALTEYVKTFKDDMTHGKTASKVSLSFSKDYIGASFNLGTSSMGWSNDIQLTTSIEHYYSAQVPSIVQPPRLG